MTDMVRFLRLPADATGLRLDMQPPTWQRSANCLGVDPDLFFPERGGSTAKQRRSAAVASSGKTACSTPSKTARSSGSGAAFPKESAAASAVVAMGRPTALAKPPEDNRPAQPSPARTPSPGEARLNSEVGAASSLCLSLTRLATLQNLSLESPVRPEIELSPTFSRDAREHSLRHQPH